jgi:hypothetical protein
MYLFQVFSKKDFLLEKEDNCKTLGSLVEAINYLVAYHDETNHYLQIQLMKYQTMFDYFDQNVSSYGNVREGAAIEAGVTAPATAVVEELPMATIEQKEQKPV